MTKPGMGLKAKASRGEEMLSAAELFQRRKRRILSGEEKMMSETRPTVLSVAVQISLLGKPYMLHRFLIPSVS